MRILTSIWNLISQLRIQRLIIPALGLLVSACVQTSPLPQTPTETLSIKIPASQIIPSTPTPSKTHEVNPIETPTLEPLASICSPLEGITLEELHTITSNTFDQPTAFADTGHHGVDLAFFKFKDFQTMRGQPVQAILPGKVVIVVDNRFPYGNMILIETPMEYLSEILKENIDKTTPIPKENIDRFSTCSKDHEPVAWSQSNRSVYTLYAHLNQKPSFKPGDTVTCGEIIGSVGISGNSVADHLHLEVRVGPSDAAFGSIANYTQESTEEERYNYCIWAISGNFQASDPAQFWELPITP